MSHQRCWPQRLRLCGGTGRGASLALWSEGRHLSLSLSFLGRKITTILPSLEGYWEEYKLGNSYKALTGCQDYDEGSVTGIWVALGKMKQSGQWVTRVYACPQRGTSSHRLGSWETHCVQNVKSTGWGAQAPPVSGCAPQLGIYVLL